MAFMLITNVIMRMAFYDIGLSENLFNEDEEQNFSIEIAGQTVIYNSLS